MEIGSALSESFEYAKNSVWGAWKRWIILTLMSVIFPFILGYMFEIYRGKNPAPEPENYKSLFIDGIKFLVAAIIYFIPLIIIMIAAFLPAMLKIMSGVAEGGEFTMSLPDLAPFIVPVLGGVILCIILGIIITLISSVGMVRMARTGSFSEAFNFGGILDTIRAIGWGPYVIAQFVLMVVVIIISIGFEIIGSIPYVGWLIGLFLGVILTVFEARYMTLLYDSANESESPGTTW